MGKDRILYESIDNKWKNYLTEAAKYADLYEDGVAIGTADYGIYVITLDTKRGHFSMTDSVYEALTEEQVAEFEKDNIASDAEYYWNDVFDYGNSLDRSWTSRAFKNNQGEEWDTISAKDQEYIIDDVAGIIAREKWDNMGGEFDYDFGGKSEEYHLEMVSGGQGGMDSLEKPIIAKGDAQILKAAWDKLHLKSEKDMDSSELALMKKAIDVYEKLKKNKQKLLEKSLQLWFIGTKGKGGKAVEKMLKKKGYKSGKLKPGELKNIKKTPLGF